MEIVLKTNEQRLIFAIHSTGPATLVDVYAEDRKKFSGKIQPLGKAEFADVVRMAKAIIGTAP